MKTISLTLAALAFAVSAAAPALADSNSRMQDDVQHAISRGDTSAAKSGMMIEGRQAASVGLSGGDLQLLNLAVAKDHISNH